MGLTPKQPLNTKRMNWDKLDYQLKTFIRDENSGFTINVANYIMSEDEIVSELTKCGYTCEKYGDGRLLIK